MTLGRGPCMATEVETIVQQPAWRALKPVIGGMLGLVVAMGIGRFAYTPLLPVMQDEFHFSSSFAGMLASWNYLGYLVGAILAGWLPGRVHQDLTLRYRFVLAALLGSAAATEMMAFTTSHVLWAVLRGFGGFFSAVVFVLLSSLMMDWLAAQRQTEKIGFFYAGVGVGIALTGMLVPTFQQYGGWRLGWQGLGIVSLILTAGVWFTMRRVQVVCLPGQLPTANVETVPAAPFQLWGVTLAYGLEGLGYIVMATFITVFFRHVSSVPWLGNVSWILVGLAAAPSTWLWTKTARAWGWRRAIYAAYIMQATGVLLPVIWPNIITAVIGSILFGGTFMGIATLALSIGRQCAPDRAGRVIGNMTAMFGVGQAAGPILAGFVTAATHGYRLSMLISGLILLAAAALLWSARLKTS